MPITLTDLQHVNIALTGLGASPIANLSDTNDRAVTCNMHYPLLREKLLSEFPWSFAYKHVQLSALSGKPFGWDIQYQLPPTAIKAIPLAVYQNSDTNSPPYKSYKITQDRLYTNATEIWIEYEFVPDEDQWPAYFSDLIVEALKEKIEEAITGEIDGKRDLKRKVYGVDLSIPGGMLSATRRSDRRDAPVEVFQDYDILAARSQGVGGHFLV